MKNLFACIMAATVLVSGNSLPAAYGQVTDKTLAVINGEPILESAFNEIFYPIFEEYKQNVPLSEQTKQRENELRDMLLNQKIAEVILKQEVKKQKIKASKKEIQEAIDEIKKRFANDAEFIAELKKENMSMADFEKKISEQAAVRKLVKQKLESKFKMPTEVEARTLYNKIIAEIKGIPINALPEEKVLISNLTITLKRMFGEQVRVRQVFINLPKGSNQDEIKAAQGRIETIKKELQKQNFSDVATEYSEDPVSRQRNGDLGIVAKGDLLPALDKAAFSMKVGDYTKDPIKTDIGYFFLKVEERRAKRDITFDDVKNDIAEVLAHINANKAQNEYIDELKSKANIKINKNW
jgi:parvulin-like peptidyl-prolyl isomerase